MAKTAYPPYTRTRGHEHSAWYLNQHLITFLATKEDTGGQFGLIEALSRRGVDPPAHVHPNEDESFFILDGEIDFLVDGELMHGKPGMFVFIPRGTEHQPLIRSEEVRVLILSTPAGLEDYFREMSDPAETLTVPTSSDGPLDLKRMTAAARKQGSEFTSYDS